MSRYARGGYHSKPRSDAPVSAEQGETRARRPPLRERLIECHAIELTVSSR